MQSKLKIDKSVTRGPGALRPVGREAAATVAAPAGRVYLVSVDDSLFEYASNHAVRNNFNDALEAQFARHGDAKPDRKD